MTGSPVCSLAISLISVYGIIGVPFERDLSHHRPRPRRNVEGQIDLVLQLVALLRARDFRLVESVLFQHPLDSGLCRSSFSFV